jgi:hypothetical protein
MLNCYQVFFAKIINKYYKAPYTRPEVICPGTSKLACWRVQLSTASKVGRRGAGTATTSIEASLLAGDIIHPPAQMVQQPPALKHHCWRAT